MTTTNHFRPHSDFLRETEAWTAALDRCRTRRFFKGDRVIVKESGWDGIVEAIDDKAIYVLMDNGPVRGLTDYQPSEIEFWSHGK